MTISRAAKMSPTKADGKIDRLAELAADLVRLKVDNIVVAGGTIHVQATKSVTKTILIAMTGAGIDPIEIFIPHNADA